MMQVVGREGNEGRMSTLIAFLMQLIKQMTVISSAAKCLPADFRKADAPFVEMGSTPFYTFVLGSDISSLINSYEPLSSFHTCVTSFLRQNQYKVTIKGAKVRSLPDDCHGPLIV